MKIFRKILLLTLAAVLVLCVSAPMALAAEEISPPARSVVLAEATTGEILYEYQTAVEYQDANLSKLMTLLLAAEAIESNRVSAEDKVQITEEMLPDEETEYRGVNLVAEEIIGFGDLLYCIQMASADDAANAVAVHVARSIPAFVDLMNEKAKELGCNHTYFTTPSGLNAEGEYTTAKDAYRVFTAALSFPILETVLHSMRYTVPATNVASKRSLYAENALRDEDGEDYLESCSAGCLSGNSYDGYMFAAAAGTEELSLIAVVFGDYSPNLFSGAKRLFEWGFGNFSWRTVISTDTVLGYRKVELSEDNKPVKIVPSSDITLLLDNDILDTDLKRDVVIYSEKENGSLKAPIAPGDILGELTLRYRNKSYGTVKLVSGTNVDLMRTEYIKTSVKDVLKQTNVRRVIAGVIVMFVLYFAYVLFDLIRRYRKKRKLNSIKKRLIEERRSGGRPPAETAENVVTFKPGSGPPADMQ